MWTRLNDPDLRDLMLRCCREEEAEVLAGILAQASTRPWASEVSVVTSHGWLHLTSQLEHGAAVNGGAVHFALNQDRTVSVVYSPPGASARSVLTKPPDEVIPALELMLIRLLHDHGTPTAEQASKDKDQARPSLELGAPVRVILNERNRTPRSGVIADRIWHHKSGCWIYCIEAGGKPVKKRYLAEDLERLA